MLNSKAYYNSFNSWIDKKDINLIYLIYKVDYSTKISDIEKKMLDHNRDTKS